MYMLWRHDPTRTYNLAESTDVNKLAALADELQISYRETRRGSPNRLYTPDYPRFTVRAADWTCVYSAWVKDSQIYKTIKGA